VPVAERTSKVETVLMVALFVFFHDFLIQHEKLQKSKTNFPAILFSISLLSVPNCNKNNQTKIIPKMF
jgi:hypothetical protein